MKEHLLIFADGHVELFTRKQKLNEFYKRFEDAKETGNFHVLEIQQYKWCTKIQKSERVSE